MRLPIRDVMASIAAEVSAVVSFPVGRGEAPPNATPPYAFVSALVSESDGPAADPDVDQVVTVQWSCVGETAEQAEWVADQIRAATDRPIPPAGWTYLYGPRLASGSSTLIRDDTVIPAWFLLVDEYEVGYTPT